MLESLYEKEQDKAAFKDKYYCCYAIHELYDHQNWTLQDIAMINNIEITVEVSNRGETGKF